MRLHNAANILLAVLTLAAAWLATPAWAAEKRIALVVGNAAYRARPLATAANDAGLVAQALQAAGFDVIGARDLDEDGLRKSLRDFVDKAAAAGPDTVTFVYLAGYGLQLEGENYFAPIDLRVASAADVGLRALRVSDYTKSLAALPLKARFFVLDGARRTPFTVPEKPLAGGLALTEAEPGSLIAFNAAPGTVGPDEKGPYGAYAQALVEMIREGGLQPGPLFDRVRLRVDAATKGAEVPWDADRTSSAFVFFDRAANAPALGRERVATLRDRPLRDLGVQDAYAVCLERDDLTHYQEFVTDYPGDALARRVRALVAARREALVWRSTWLVGTPDAYWSYLAWYPRGPHAWDARRRLASLAAALEPPPRYAVLAYDVLPPAPEEIVYVDRPVLFLDDPVFALPPPPRPALIFLPPPAYLVALAPPAPVLGVYALPTPPIMPVPAYVSAPDYVMPPPNNVLFQNIHNTAAIEQINRQNTGVQAPAAGPGSGLGVAATRIALPAALQHRAAVAPAPLPGTTPPVAGMAAGSRSDDPRPGPLPSGPQAALPALSAQPGAAHALPGTNGQPLPTPASRTAGPPVVPMSATAPRAASRPAEVLPPTPVGAARPQILRSGSGALAQRLRGPAAERVATARRSVDPRATVMAQQRQDAFARHAAAQAMAAQRQQQAQAARQQQAQQAFLRHQALQAQFAQQAAQRQQQAAVRQQQAAQQQQMMARPQSAPPVARPGLPPSHGNPHPPCPPGRPCR
ncbi:caspase family protein [Methylobacterium sp. P31]